MGLLPTMHTDRLHWVPKTATTSEDYLPSRSLGEHYLYDTPSTGKVIKKETNVFRTFSSHFDNVNPNFVGQQRRLVGLRPSEFVVPNSFALAVCCFTERTLMHIKSIPEESRAKVNKNALDITASTHGKMVDVIYRSGYIHTLFIGDFFYYCIIYDRTRKGAYIQKG